MEATRVPGTAQSAGGSIHLSCASGAPPSRPRPCAVDKLYDRLVEDQRGGNGLGAGGSPPFLLLILSMRVNKVTSRHSLCVFRVGKCSPMNLDMMTPRETTQCTKRERGRCHDSREGGEGDEGTEGGHGGEMRNAINAP